MRPLRARGVYLITGGLGGVGLMIARYLARTLQARLVLVSRSGLPPRESWPPMSGGDGDPVLLKQVRRIHELEELGADVHVVRGDVADEADMRRALDETLGQFGDLHGVVHAAGITHGDSLYRSFREIGRPELDAQLAPKARGCCVLERVLSGRSLDFCLLMSSAAAVLGGLGYSAYAAANACMDALAVSRRRFGFPAISANWDPWPAETRQYRGFTTQVDVYAMTEEEAGEAFRRIACLAPEGQVAVITGDFANRLARWVDMPAVPEQSRERSARPDLDMPYDAPRDELEEQLAAIWGELLGIDRVGIHDGFFQLGGHSLLATRLIAGIRERFQVDVAIDRFFEAPTVASLATSMRHREAGVDESREAVLNVLAQLSEEEPAADDPADLPQSASRSL